MTATLDQLRAGKLAQRCDPCGITEAAGHFCTKCGRRTGPADWFVNERSEAQKAAARRGGRGRAETGSETTGSPTFGVLA